MNKILYICDTHHNKYDISELNKLNYTIDIIIYRDDIIEKCFQNKYKTLLNVAVPAGMWQKMEEIICDEKDREHIKKLRKKYGNLVRNLWNPFDKVALKMPQNIINCE